MPFSLGRLRFRRNSTSSRAPASTRTRVCDDVEVGMVEIRVDSTRATKTSPRTRLGSWLARMRSRKERGANQPSGRPPTPTPHLMLSSTTTADDARTKTLRRVRAQTTGTNVEARASKGDADEDGNDSDELNEEGDMSEAERTRLTSFASGLRGLIAQLQLADEESRSTPPMTNAEGTPLSPITETDELDSDLDHDADAGTLVSLRSPSLDEVTDLDYGEAPDVHMIEELEMEGELETELLTPRWNPDVAEFVEAQLAMASSSCRGSSRSLPHDLPNAGNDNESEISSHDEVVDNDEGRVDDDTIERELALDVECAGEPEVKTSESEPETEEDVEYFSATSLPLMTHEEDDASRSIDISNPAFGLHLRGIGLATPLTAFPDSSTDTLFSSESNEGLRPVEDETLSPTTPRPLTRIHLSSDPQPVESGSGSGLSNAYSRRQRAATLPNARARALPAVPPLSIPDAVEKPSVEGHQDVGALVRTVSQLQREKARLETELERAKLKIEQQDLQVSSLTAQIASLRAALMRLAHADTDSLSSTGSGAEYSQSIPIIVRVPDIDASISSSSEEDAADLGLVASSSKGDTGANNPLSTPPATPDRRAAVELCEGALGMNTNASGSAGGCDDDDEGSLMSTPRPKVKTNGSGNGARGLMRRKSADATSVLSELGVGRAQVKRRAGSADLKRLTTSLPWS